MRYVPKSNEIAYLLLLRYFTDLPTTYMNSTTVPSVVVFGCHIERKQSRAPDSQMTKPHE